MVVLFWKSFLMKETSKDIWDSIRTSKSEEIIFKHNNFKLYTLSLKQLWIELEHQFQIIFLMWEELTKDEPMI